MIRAVFERLHGQYVHSRRVTVLARHFAQLLPPNASGLDVGCGDGQLAKQLMELRPDVRIVGIDVLAREVCSIPFELFDGQTIPYPNDSFDVTILVDVLHHTQEPMVLLSEASRVAKTGVLIKDHLLDGLGAGPTLRFMDRVGNRRHGVVLPYNYWPHDRWRIAFNELGLSVVAWTTRLGLYPPPGKWIFERSLHFIARLDGNSDNGNPRATG